MKLLELIKYRRSIRKYKNKEIPKRDLEKVIEAGLYAPNAGSGQRSIIVGVYNKELTRNLGILNFSTFERSKLIGGHVSKEQPSIIDDDKIKDAFYGAPTVCVIFGPENFLYSVPDAFCCAENMVLMATDLDIASCIVARAEETFKTKEGKALKEEWGIPDNYTARCFVLLGYCEGKYPKPKARKENRAIIVE